MLVYVDGSALSRYLVDASGWAQWRAWATANEARIVTTPLGLTELRLLACWLDFDGRGCAHQVSERTTVIRFSDQALATAAMAQTVLSPFAALHLGAAAAHPDIGTIVTYDPLLARVAVIYGLTVQTPGLPDEWWQS